MKEYIICKSCGFIMEKGKLGQVCPACGVPAKMFEPYVEKMSEKRKFILSLDMHPILVHFSIAFSITIFLLSIVSFILTGWLKTSVISTIYVLSLCLPFTVIISFIAGIIDGNTRFRRVTTPILKNKIILGILFFIFSIAMFIISIIGLSGVVYPAAMTILSAGCMVCDFILGILGKDLVNAKFPG